jgi:cold shock CspA family protein
MKGVIAFFDPRKGFGFVSTAGEDIFFHRSALPSQDRHRKFQDCECEFEIGEFNGRQCAISVHPQDAHAETSSNSIARAEALALLGGGPAPKTGRGGGA